VAVAQTGTLISAKLQSDHSHQHSSTQFYMLDTLPTTQLTVYSTEG